MRQSAYTVTVADGDRVLAVNLRTRAALELSHEAYDRLGSWSVPGAAVPSDLDERELFDALVAGGLLIADDLDELAYIRQRTEEERFATSQLGLVIAPTMGCNFNCSYCFEDKTDAVLSPEACASIVDLVRERVGTFDSLAVQWFGGEPLRQPGVIATLSESFLRLAAAHDFAYAATVITNGMLLDAAVSAQLVRLGVTGAQVTLDGDRERHDRTRHERGGGGSFDEILRNVRNSPPELAVTLRVHLTPVTFDSVMALLDTLAHEQLQPHVAAIYFAPLFHYRANRPGRMYITDGRRFATSREFAAMEIPVLRKAQSLGFRTRDFLDVSYGICTAVRSNTLVVDADGRLSKCYKDCGVDSEAFGWLDRPATVESNLRKWLDVGIPRDEECRACTFLPVCLGGCTKEWHEQADKAVICTPLKFNVADRIRLYFDEPE